jgi:hypothetical protein
MTLRSAAVSYAPSQGRLVLDEKSRCLYCSMQYSRSSSEHSGVELAVQLAAADAVDPQSPIPSVPLVKPAQSPWV